ncbi:hypothetical protein MRB53_004251 [Persea americana]|uniref:Uncharacterized protein n=1 Tax=Persea americana TaxID=3435 RepID=A0ACC2MA88_PERAE|nr:hypothetical protein MRB53_004251 [Persea americana]
MLDFVSVSSELGQVLGFFPLNAEAPHFTESIVLGFACRGSLMAVTSVQSPLLGETTCGTLLQQLQQIWDEVGESDEVRDKMLLQLEQECLDVYKRKVDQASKSRAQLLQDLANSQSELTHLLSALGEKSIVVMPEKSTGTIKEQLATIEPVLEKLWKQKEERIKEFTDIQSQIQKICGEIAGTLKVDEQMGTPIVDEDDLSLKKLDEFQSQLQELQKEKSDRLHKVLDFVSTVHDLCAVLGMDFFSTITEVHPSLNDSVGMQSKSISNDTLSRLAKTVLALKEDKRQRLQKAYVFVYYLWEENSEHELPLVDTLVVKTRTWEEEHGLSFTYDGVPLLAMLDEYAILRHDREEDKRRMRDQKRFHEQLNTEQEAIFGSRPSPNRPLAPKKVVGPRANGGGSNGTPSRRLSLNANGARSASKDGKKESNRLSAPLNYVAIAKEDAASHVSGGDPVPASP